MCSKILFPLAALAAAGLGQSAFAQANPRPAYKASDIVSHFAPQPDLGPPRALCIGTESECAKAIAPKPKPAGNFDLVVNFEYNSATLTKAAKSNLDEFAKALKDPRLGSAAFLVEGHTDGKGSDEFNLDLSTRRANAVVEYLTAQGVDTARLEAKGYGKQKPIGGNPLASTNRRVETRLRTE
ncbi:OmpA family protein [Enterovirga aerilata]|uniref:OmpA family protein n=1 Tax=Enterovirga aerilata TaxID=2730920 RepID=A0A849IEV9_9HYPH|nr:OmpA family protein [Enterovirga sp. DB1703]NNM74640.1 OmpA family protein [Enterovirga sp. DB1703]